MNNPEFCNALVRDPVATLRARGIEPTPEVIEALKAVDGEGLRKLVSAFGQQQGLLALAMVSSAAAQKVSFQFSQVFPDGTQVDGFAMGEDLDGDGRLYSMAPLMAGFLGLPPGDEVEYVSLHFRNLVGRSFTQVYSKAEGGLSDPDNTFFAFAYNLNDGPFGDDPNEGIFLGPLAPSTSYVMGPLIQPVSMAQPEAWGPCGNAEGRPCAAITSLLPEDPFPNFQITFNLFGGAAVTTTRDLRFEFRHAGFSGGGVVRGWVAGRDLDGDGRLYSVGPFVSEFLEVPEGDELLYMHTDLEGFDGNTWRHTTDFVATPRDEFVNAFMWFGYNLSTRHLGSEGDEGFFLGPLAPSTSFAAGRYPPFNVNLAFEDEPFGLCGEPEALCSAVFTLVPTEPFPTVETTFAEFSAQTIEMVPAPLVADGQFSGLWFDPSHSGEGFSLTPMADGGAAVAWYTYDEIGAQRWFVGVGRREGLSLIFDEMIETSGGLFGPDFDPDTVERRVVGDLRIDCAHCNGGSASYTLHDVPGSQNLVRLTRADGLRCHGPQG